MFINKNRYYYDDMRFNISMDSIGDDEQLDLYVNVPFEITVRA